MNKLEFFIRQIPKAELHVHLEGTIQPKILLKLAGRHGIKLPFSDEEGARRFFRFRNFGQFLEKFELACSTLRTPEDFSTLIIELGADSARQNIFYREVFFTYAQHERRGIPWDTIIDSLSTGCKEAKRSYNVEMKFIADIAGTQSPEAGVNLVELAHASRNEVPIIGIGLDSRKIDKSTKKHQRAFKLAKELGFHCVAHAGEEDGPEYVWDAIEVGIERIDHGVRSIEDSELLAYLAKTQLPLTVCPVSNVLIKVYPSIAEHPIKRLMDAGLMVTVNSDDPAMFGSDLIDNYIQVANQFKLGPSDIERLALNSIKAGFLESSDVRRYEKEFHDRVSSLRTKVYGTEGLI